MSLFDTHCHLGYDPTSRSYQTELAADEHARARAADVAEMVLVGVDAATSRAACELGRALDGVYWTAGLHPCSADRWADEQEAITELAHDSACIAIGESGIDLFHDRASLSDQIKSFEQHLELAATLGKPIVIHCRDGYDDAYRTVSESPRVAGVMHCFSGNRTHAGQALELDLYLSFAGPLTYPRNDELRAAAASAPAERLLVETDAPFLPPQGHRGERNEPARLALTLRCLAEVRGWTVAEAARITTDNARRLFGLDGPVRGR